MAHVDTSRLIDRSALDAFEKARDGLADLTPMMPNISAIEAIDRRVEGATTVRIDRWRAQADGWLRRLIPDGLASWVVQSNWDPERLRIDWELLEVDAPLDVACTGHITIVDRHPGAVVYIVGSLHVLRAPRLVRRQWVEPRLMAVVERNLVGFFSGVNRSAA